MSKIKGCTVYEQKCHYIILTIRPEGRQLCRQVRQLRLLPPQLFVIGGGRSVSTSIEKRDKLDIVKR